MRAVQHAVRLNTTESDRYYGMPNDLGNDEKAGG